MATRRANSMTSRRLKLNRNTPMRTHASGDPEAPLKRELSLGQNHGRANQTSPIVIRLDLTSTGAGHWFDAPDSEARVTLASGNARKTMKCGRRSLLISMRDRSADICRLFHDAEAAMISANDRNRFSTQSLSPAHGALRETTGFRSLSLNLAASVAGCMRARKRISSA